MSHLWLLASTTLLTTSAYYENVYQHLGLKKQLLRMTTETIEVLVTATTVWEVTDNDDDK